MNQSVWDDLREDAREFARKNPTAGHTLVFVPDRNAEGAGAVNVRRRSRGAHWVDAEQEIRSRAIAADPGHRLLAAQLQQSEDELADLLASPLDGGRRLGALGHHANGAWICHLRQAELQSGEGFVGEWLSVEHPPYPTDPALNYELRNLNDLTLRVSDMKSEAVSLGWLRLCERLWSLARKRVGDQVPAAIVPRTDAPTIGTHDSICDAARLLHWLAWSGVVQGLRAEVQWRLSFVPDNESQLQHHATAPRAKISAQPFTNGYPEQPDAIPGMPWLRYAGWWWSTIDNAGAALVSAVDFLKPREPGFTEAIAEFQASVAGAIESLRARDDDGAQEEKLPKLKAHDRQAWQLATLHGMTQAKVAVKLNEEHGTSYTQGQVSRMIARAKAHADANGLSEKVPGPIDRPRTIDPARLELGARVDKRKPRPSDMARVNDDDE